jgi:protein SCO1/2
MKIKIKIVILSLILIYGCSKNENSRLPFYSSAELTPLWLDEGDPRLDTMHAINKFSFTDQSGSTITNESFKNKIYIANFFFTSCPGICPVMTKNLLKVQEEFKNDNDVMFISHSVMPWVDSLSQLKNYAQTYGVISNKWHLVTGSKKALYEAAWYSYLVEEEPGFSADSSEFIHTEHIMLVDTKGRIRGVYNGTLQLEMERLITDVNILKKET